jgi:hypothetical protein
VYTDLDTFDPRREAISVESRAKTAQTIAAHKWFVGCIGDASCLQQG